MKFHIPFTFSEIEKLKKRSRFFSSRIKYKKKTKLSEYLDSAESKLTREEYIGICVRSFFTSFIVLYLIFSTFY